jgi:hypothetical protein
MGILGELKSALTRWGKTDQGGADKTPPFGKIGLK